MKQKILVILGPTASGKSALAVKLAKKLNGEVISADSRQVYKGLDIGTGKIPRREMRGVPHHLLDVASPKKHFSAGDFVKLARRKIKTIYHTGKLPIVVGGTGYYIDALAGRVILPNVAPDMRLRARLQKKTALQLYALLKKRDPKRAHAMSSKSERNNKVRLIRALEIAKYQGRSSVKLPRTVLGNTSSYDVLWLGINPPLKTLEKKIAVRLFARMRGGMVAEARKLHGAGLSYKRMEELGLEYRSLARFLQKKISKSEMETVLRRDILRYAKKQMSYWKRNKDIKWFRPTGSKKIARAIQTWLR